MELRDKTVIVTGGASGIGKALAERFHTEGARHVVVADRDAEGAEAVAAAVGGSAAAIDVTDEAAIRDLVERTESEHGPIDLFVSNAGYVTVGGLEVPNAEITNMFDVHVMAHVYAARAVVPSMMARGEGYLLNTASAAGLLSQIGSLAYSVTKHAAVALAEWLAISYGDRGIRVSVLCPQAVESNIIANSPSRRTGDGFGVAGVDGVLKAEDLAQTVVETLAEERFWVLPHPEVAQYVERKAGDIDRWLAGMRRFQSRVFADEPGPAEWLAGEA
ncbi:MAG TPA: SDR family oxidoreductase [Acidimicrobiales bacterium]|nr:SDR family oxidoreductase [Acidimicrobiales bacterium]